MKLSKSQTRILRGILTGHCRLRAHLSKLEIVCHARVRVRVRIRVKVIELD